MILRNSKGMEKNFRILFKLLINDKSYVVYEDINTLNIYSGEEIDNHLEPTTDEEIDMLNKLLERIWD